MKKLITLSLAFLFTTFGVVHSQSQSKDVFRDETATIDARIKDLLSKMTVKEKIGLLRATSPAIPRLGIDKYYHGNEALHGVVRPGHFTVFPQAIALAAMWDSNLHYKVASTISDEARAKWNELEQGKKQLAQFSDLLTFWSPTINMARDPRWGRTPETYGEDPYLSGVLGTQFVKGLQGNDPRYLKVVSTPKHFAVNNEEHNRMSCNPQVSERVLREYYLPAFEMCVKEGKAQSIMSAYNAINDVPCSANPWLLTKVLRKDWGFQGYVVSDCGAPQRVVDSHKYVKNVETAAMIEIKAGLDLECGDDVFIEPLMNAYKHYMVSDADIDSAAYHVLRARMKLGLFDNPDENPYNKLSPSIVGSPEHKALALQSALESMVLLKNKQGTLPINLKKIKSIAVVGINAGHCELGDYSGTPVGEPVSILDGIKNRVGKDVKVVYAPWISSEDGNELISKAYFPNGLKAEYFSNRDLEGTPKIRTDEWINYDPANQAPDPFLPQAPMSIRWTGVLKPTVTGTYTLGFTTDDGCRLSIDGKQLINSWQTRSAETDKVDVQLEAGKEYKLQAEYFDQGQNATAKLSWKAPINNIQDPLEVYGEADKAVRNCDLTIAVLGINKTIEREGQDRKDIKLPADQEAFIKAVYKANPNTIVVLVAGSSLDINWINDNIPAVLDAWYPGEQGGTAVAKVLFGDYNPAGRLPLTFYNSVDELPAFDDYDVTKGRTYQYFNGKVLYPFGYGLSYTTFAYKNLDIKDNDENLSVGFEVKNTGKVDGDEVTQLYVKLPPVNGLVLPIKQLKGFKRVTLKKGQSNRVEIEVPKSQLRYWDSSKESFVSPKGNYTIMIGSSSADIRLSKNITL